MGRSFGILDSRILKGSTVGSKSEGRHEGGTRDPRRDHVRIPKEIVLIRESAVAEFLADHERVPEKNRACKGCSKGAQRGISNDGGRVKSVFFCFLLYSRTPMYMRSCALLLGEWFAVD